MASPEQARKWREAHSDYRKNWYRKNRDKVREGVKQKYYEKITKKRMEEIMASVSDDEWKIIPGFENYRVNSKGDVMNKFGKLLKPSSFPTGYKHVSLSNNEKKTKHMYIHQLVWLAFNGEIPEGFVVCHKDTDKDNNSLDNLCLMTRKENFNKPLTIERFKQSQILYPRTKGGREKKKVYQYDSDGNLVNTWDSIMSTKEGGFSPASVSRCCNGKEEMHKGFVWSFKEAV